MASLWHRSLTPTLGCYGHSSCLVWMQMKSSSVPNMLGGLGRCQQGLSQFVKSAPAQIFLVTFLLNITTNEVLFCMHSHIYISSSLFVSHQKQHFYSLLEHRLPLCHFSCLRVDLQNVSKPFLAFDIKPQCTLCQVSFGCLPSALHITRTRRVVRFWLCGAFLGSFWRLCMHTFLLLGEASKLEPCTVAEASDAATSQNICCIFTQARGLFKKPKATVNVEL